MKRIRLEELDVQQLPSLQMKYVNGGFGIKEFYENEVKPTVALLVLLAYAAFNKDKRIFG